MRFAKIQHPRHPGSVRYSIFEEARHRMLEYMVEPFSFSSRSIAGVFNGGLNRMKIENVRPVPKLPSSVGSSGMRADWPGYGFDPSRKVLRVRAGHQH